MLNYLNKALITILAATILLIHQTFGQLDFQIDPSYCQDQGVTPIVLNNVYSNLEWDFCVSPFEDTLNISFLSGITGGGRNLGIDFIELAGTWYAVATSWNNNNLFLLTFANGLTNSPNIKDLGNPDNVLNQPVSIGLVERGGIVYALIHNWGSENLVKVKFDDGVTGVTQTGSVVYGPFGSLLSKMVIVDTSDELQAIVINPDATVGIINFQNDINRTILTADVTVSVPIAGASSPRDIEMIRVGSNWYGFVASFSTGIISRVDFGTDISTGIKGTATTVADNIFGGERVNNIELIVNGGIYELHAATFEGNLFKVKLGTDITIEGITSGAVQYGSEFLLIEGYTMSYFRYRGEWYGFVMNDQSAKLYGITSTTPCRGSIGYSNTENPFLTYDQAGSYDISLTGYNDDGTNEIITKSISITSSVAPQIQVTSAGNCLTNPVSFSGQQLSGDITSWSWDFGDGSGTSTLQNPDYTYSATGEYQIILTVTDANGCSNLLIDSISIYDEPLPDFTVPAGTLCMSNAILFTNTTSGESGPVVSWAWDFNGEGTSTDKEPIFTFLSSGNKTITLTSSLPGCANVIQKNIFVEEAPNPGFTYNDVCNTTTSIFTDQSTGTDLTDWNWDFGDGNISSDQNPSHTYTNPGQYDVVLTVSNGLGCSASLTQTVFNHAIPVLEFQYELPCSSAEVQFTDQSLVQNANIVAWSWDFGDPGSSGNTSSIQNPVHLFNTPGDYNVKLIAYSQFGCVDSLTKIINVLQGPDVQFSWDKACAGEPTTFADQTISFGIPVSGITWIIDGVVYEDVSAPSHTFGTPGIYSVSLGVTLDNLCGQTLVQDIIIAESPQVAFGFDELCDDDLVKLFDLTSSSADPVVTRSWFIDGQPHNQADSTITVSLAPGEYLITLDVMTNSGCDQAASNIINLSGAPRAEFAMAHSFGAAPFTVGFNNLSTGAEFFLWDFGDGKSASTKTNPTFTFESEGVYQVQLIASDGTNCADTSVYQSVEVVSPVADVVLNAINPLATGNTTRFALDIHNSGTILLHDNLEIVFRLDNGAEVVEVFRDTLHAEENNALYIPGFSLGNTLSARLLCVALRVKNNENKIVAADKGCINLDELAVVTNIYPNPAADHFQIDVIIPTKEAIELKVLDRNGALIFNKVYTDVTAGLNEFVIDARTYRSGMYLVQVKYQGLSRELKAVISK
jgi:PKD repeat protein